MRDPKSLSHTRWDCKYHVVFIPKKRRTLIFGAIRKHLGDIFHDLCFVLLGVLARGLSRFRGFRKNEINNLLKIEHDLEQIK